MEQVCTPIPLNRYMSKVAKEVIAADFLSSETEENQQWLWWPMVWLGCANSNLINLHNVCKAVYTVVLFDYRYWGGGTGRPRELVSIKQLEDWRTMINHLKERKSIDNRRIVLWGQRSVVVMCSILQQSSKCTGRDGASAFCGWGSQCQGYILCNSSPKP